MLKLKDAEIENLSSLKKKYSQYIIFVCQFTQYYFNILGCQLQTQSPGVMEASKQTGLEILYDKKSTYAGLWFSSNKNTTNTHVS